MPPPAVPPGPRPAASATAPAASAAAPSPFDLPALPREDEAADGAAREAVPLDLAAWDKARKAKGVAAAPAACAGFATRAPAAAVPADLASALGEKDPALRDSQLVSLEKKPGASAAMIRGLRADLGPVECGDAMVDPFLEKNRAVAGVDAHVLVGLSLAAKLARTANTPPAMGALRDKEKVKAFIGGPLKTWLLDQSTAIETLASGAAGLAGYGRGIAAIEAGIAEMRLVDKMRSSPVPATWDPELKAIYETSLDEALEPRKKRGRDAALVGMSDFARAGILRDARLVRARALISKLYGGRRVDALDALLLPSAPPASPTTPSDLAIASVSTFWLDSDALGFKDDPRVLSRGVTTSIRQHMRKLGDRAAGRAAYARTRLDMGRVYWRRADFVEAAHAMKDAKRPEDRLVLAAALALVHAPNGAAEMMRAPSPAALDLAHTEALDALVLEGGPLAGAAAYDAAYLRALSPPEGPAAMPYLRDVASRFRKAESLFMDAPMIKEAAQRAAEVDAIVAATFEKSDRAQP